jgi:hypothetical protein
VLLSLGGFGEDEELQVAPSARHHLLVTSARLPRPSSNASYIEVGEIGHPMFGHHELVAAVDCVIGKPGYGTVAECLRRPTPLCWLSRSGFREEPKLVEAIERWLPSAHLTLDDLASGRWQDQVDAALASAPREPPPTPEGATQAATLLRSFLIKSK